ncbi:MAG TPA: SMP-30/gluconolactonase/LRE family protein, partial [Solirubrobacteraceae bacterium]|nr:SMP-30/gluconolactonase/LRE family protein [Solirubrobacteraceae bacterium]
LAEGPIWDAAGERLIWIDIVARIVHSFDPATGENTSIAVEDSPGLAIPRTAGGLVMAIGHGFAFLDADGELEPIEELPQAEIPARFNDGCCDAAGRLWAGTVGLGEEPGAGSLYRLDPDLTVTRVIDTVTESNGIDWSPDNTIMYYVDSLEYRVDAFDFDLDSGSLSNRRPFAEYDSSVEILPDGLTVDSEGGVWVALWGGSAVHRYTPDGELDRVLAMPTRQITSCAFAGPSLEDFYVTSAREWLEPEVLADEPDAGAVFVCRPGVVGRPARTFGG